MAVPGSERRRAGDLGEDADHGHLTQVSSRAYTSQGR